MNRITALLIVATAGLPACQDSGLPPLGPTFGAVRVSVATTGDDLDSDGYALSLDGYASRTLDVNGAVLLSRVSTGSHEVALTGVAPNCAVSGGNPRSVIIREGQTADVSFEVTCLLATGTIEVTVATSGAELDSNGYTIGVDDASLWDYGPAWSAAASVNDTVRFTKIPVGDHQVYLYDVAGNCAVTGADLRTVTVPPGDTAKTAFAVTCQQTGSVQVTVTTTGVDLDPDGYNVQVQGAIHGVTTNGTVTIPGLLAGELVVTLYGVAVNCGVGGTNPQTVTVPSGGTAVVQFDVACTAPAQLAFVSTTDRNEEIYLIKADGTGLTRLTTDPASDAQPAWSPDGDKIAFATNRDGNYDIYVMDADGQSPARRTTASGADYSPAWSPDGSKIAFTSDRDGNAEIYVMSADGSNPVRLTNHPDSDADPAWSPDGSTIAFASTRDGSAEIYLMDAAGSGLTRLTINDVDDVQPEWSPDVGTLVFSRLAWCDEYTGFCDYNLFVMNVYGSIVAQLTFASSDTDAAWSPDGRWIAYGVASAPTAGTSTAITATAPFSSQVRTEPAPSSS